MATASPGCRRLRVVGQSEDAPFAVIADESRHFYGVQFHPEVVHTPHGAQLLRNFVHHVAGCGGEWTMAAFREEEIARIRAKVGKGKVICGLSGGVDSRCRRAAARSDRRSAHLHLRRYRPDAYRGGRSGRHPVPRPLQHPAGPSRRIRPVPWQAGGCQRSGKEAQDHRWSVHRRVRRGSARSAVPSSWLRARFIPTSSKASHYPAADDHQVAPQCRRSAGANEPETS